MRYLSLKCLGKRIPAVIPAILCLAPVVWILISVDDSFSLLLNASAIGRWSKPRRYFSDLCGDVNRVRDACCCADGRFVAGTSLLKPDLDSVPSESELLSLHSSLNISRGGFWAPKGCVGSQTVALIIPFRKREAHLQIFLRHIHKYLQKQKLSYGIYVVDQVDDMEFNRAMLFNVGFLEAMKDRNYTCFVFHDVDHLPVDPLLSYWCDSMPTHMASRTDKWDWRLPYRSFVGGVTKQLASQIYAMNGFANVFWGWGGEDDDIRIRWWITGLRLRRPLGQLGNYATIKKSHYRAKDTEGRVDPHVLLRSSRKRVFTDGLNNVKYELVSKHYHALYTRISVNLVADPTFEYLHKSHMFSGFI